MSANLVGDFLHYDWLKAYDRRKNWKYFQVLRRCRKAFTAYVQRLTFRSFGRKNPYVLRLTAYGLIVNQP